MARIAYLPPVGGGPWSELRRTFFLPHKMKTFFTVGHTMLENIVLGFSVVEI